MRILKMVLLALTLLGFTGVAKADSIDPAVGVQGSGDASTWTGSVDLIIPSSTSVFLSPAFFLSSGTITDFFIHSNSGALTFTALFPDQGQTVTPTSPTMDAILSGFTICPSDPPSCTIFGDFQLAIVNTTGYDIDLTFSSSNSVPEPGTLILLGTGLGLLGLRRLRRKAHA